MKVDVLRAVADEFIAKAHAALDNSGLEVPGQPKTLIVRLTKAARCCDFSSRLLCILMDQCSLSVAERAEGGVESLSAVHLELVENLAKDVTFIATRQGQLSREDLVELTHGLDTLAAFLDPSSDVTRLLRVAVPPQRPTAQRERPELLDGMARFIASDPRLGLTYSKLPTAVSLLLERLMGSEMDSPSRDRTQASADLDFDFGTPSALHPLPHWVQRCPVTHPDTPA